MKKHRYFICTYKYREGCEYWEQDEREWERCILDTSRSAMLDSSKFCRLSGNTESLEYAAKSYDCWREVTKDEMEAELVLELL